MLLVSVVPAAGSIISTDSALQGMPYTFPSPPTHHQATCLITRPVMLLVSVLPAAGSMISTDQRGKNAVHLPSPANTPQPTSITGTVICSCR